MPRCRTSGRRAAAAHRQFAITVLTQPTSLARSIRRGRWAPSLVADQYGMYVTLLRLPPYSPELNPIENVWEYLRANQLSRGVWQSYDDIVQVCCDAWNWLIADTVRVSSITTRKWASVNT